MKIVEECLNNNDEESLRNAFKVLLDYWKLRNHNYDRILKVFDADNSGCLSVEEVSDIMTNKGAMKLSPEELQEMLAKVDTDRDGKLQYEEFVKLFVQKSQ